MRSFGKTTAISAALAGVALILFFLWLWQPGRQLILHQRHLLQAVEKRDWKKVSAFMADEYRDRWGFDKQRALQLASEVLRQFFVVSIIPEDLEGAVDSSYGIAFARLKLDGQGTAPAQEAIRRVNALKKPFRFEWHRTSWKPWDWRLVKMDQPELRIPAEATESF